MTWYPPLTLSITAADPDICPGDTVLLSSQVVGNAATYQWLQNGIPVPGAVAPTHPATSAGDYVLQITDANGCAYHSDTLNLLPGNPPLAGTDAPSDSLICAGRSISLQGHGTGTYQWLLNGQPIPGATDSVYDATASGSYSLVVENGCGADTSAGIDLIASPGPQAAFDYENYPHSEVLFFNESTHAIGWVWNLGTLVSEEENIYYGFPGPGSYPVTLVVTDSLGCTDSLTLTVTVKDPEFFVPNVFTPNGDGINDQARTRFTHLVDIRFCIFDRWGNKIFISNSPDVYWDGSIQGKPAPEGVYYFEFKAMDIRGKVISEAGNITLLR
jgi:gliding motility-associated-like protein